MKLLIAAIIVLMATGVWASWIPPECTGKEVSCTEGMSMCTAVYCPTITKYDANGNFMGLSGGDCNTCTTTKRCWCDGHSFEVTERR